MLRLLCLYSILHIQYLFLEASPIVGEDVRIAYLEEFPFIVSIGYKTCGTVEDKVIINKQFCGGSLITDKLVLTAAHCLTHKHPKNLVVKIGSIDVLSGDTYKVLGWLTFSEWTTRQLPPGYNKDLVHDIAIIKIKGSASHIELPTISYTPDTNLYDKSVVTVGWGLIDGNKKPRYMRVAKFFIKSPEKCEPFISEPDPFLKYVWPKINLCTDSTRGITLTCGDSGSPLLRDENNIVGVANGACKPEGDGPLSEYRNMYASVYAYREFIEDVKKI